MTGSKRKRSESDILSDSDDDEDDCDNSNVNQGETVEIDPNEEAEKEKDEKDVFECLINEVSSQIEGIKECQGESCFYPGRGGGGVNLQLSAAE